MGPPLQKLLFCCITTGQACLSNLRTALKVRITLSELLINDQIGTLLPHDAGPYLGAGNTL
jgi:hypothetical protein